MGPTGEQNNNPRRIAERLDSVRARIAAAAGRAARDPEGVTLLVVTKYHPPEVVRALLDAGHETVGENRVPEALDKIEALGGRGEWHFIGHLQRNKARRIVGRVALIHSVDSPALIQELEKRAAQNDLVQPILLQINIGAEPAKTGAAPELLPALLDALATAPHLRAEGLMVMAPYDPDPERARPHFARLRALSESIAPCEHFHPRHLSMGMSGDFEVAVEEGATIVRLGSAILGERPRP